MLAFCRLIVITSVALLACAAGWTAGPQIPAASAPPYTLENTEVLSVAAPGLQRTYDIYVSLPANCATSARRCPVVYVTDAPYAFPLIRAIAGRVDRHGTGLEDFILVGLGYAHGESGVVSRNRDYTPTDRRNDLKPQGGLYGQGALYLDYLAREVVPLVNARYRADPRRRIYVGHSYGSLLGLQAMLERPGLFSHFILGSPSLWFDEGQSFKALQRFALTHVDLDTHVRLYVGGLERPSARQPDAEDMVSQMRSYVTKLRAGRWRGLDVQAKVLEGEDHATVFPRLVTQGLIWALPKSR